MKSSSPLRQGRLFLSFLLVSALALCGLPVAAQSTAALMGAVDNLSQDRDMLHASLSVSVRDAATGDAVYSYDAYRSLAPASLVKIFTTAAGFDMLGSAFRFTTTVGYVGEVDKKGVLHGDVYIIGGGDPLLGSYRFRQTQPDTVFAAWQKALLSEGIHAVEGKVRYYAGIFDGQQLPDTWQWGDIGNYYAAGVCGLNFHENMFFINFNAGERVGFPASVAGMEPANLDVNLQNRVTTGEAGTGDQVVVYGEPSSNVRVCRGTVPVGKKGFGVRAAMPKPAETCAELFAVYLRKHGCRVSGSVEEVSVEPRDMNVALKYMTNPYYVVAQYTNLTSNNTYAECIYKYLGYRRYGVGSYVNGGKALNDFFHQMGLAADGVHIVDGSGLSRQNRCTVDFLTRFMAQVSRMEIYGDFLQTLGEVGKSGTVRNMNLGLPSDVKVYVKSGSMDGIASYAGYVVKGDGKAYSFAVISNGYDCTGDQMQSKLEKIIKEIASV